MLCPYCKNELSFIDSFGKYLNESDWLYTGEIFQCDNLDCESGVFDFFFYTQEDSEKLYEGYPC